MPSPALMTTMGSRTRRGRGVAGDAVVTGAALAGGAAGTGALATATG